ncbi:MAG: RNA polymerase sigma factor, partial [Chthoniobacterales bacterium]
MSHAADHDFPALLQAVANGDEEAACIFHHQFAPRLHKVVSRFLNRHCPELRLLYDSLDFVQETFLAFLKSHAADNATFERPEQLHAYFEQTAVRRVFDALRRHTSGKRNELYQRRSLDDHALPNDSHVISREPSASARVEKRERLELLLMQLPPHHARILELAFDGRSLTDIAAILHLDERTVRRVLVSLRRAAVVRNRSMQWLRELSDKALMGATLGKRHTSPQR